MDRVLLIDDDRKLGELLERYFAQFGLSLVQVTLPLEGMQLLRREKFDALILDVMLPQLDGFEVCKKIRAFSDIPMIMLTARGEVSDRVLGIELGVDDYLAKPFETRELVARVKGLIRRARKAVSAPKLRAGELMIDMQAGTALLAGADLKLSTLEFELLKLLMTNAQQTLSRDRLMDELRGIDWEAYNRSIDVAVSRLRVKLGDSAKTPKYLRTVWGEGYRFIATTEESA